MGYYLPISPYARYVPSLPERDKMENKSAYRTISVSPWNVRKGDEITLTDHTDHPNRQIRVVVTEVKKGILGPFSGKRRYQIFWELSDKSDIPWWVGGNWSMWYADEKVEINRPKTVKSDNPPK